MAFEGMENSLNREEAKRILRRLELDAYSSIITAFRAQGDLSREKKVALNDLATHLSISTERHRAEVRRVVNDDRLSAVAECMYGPGTETEWSTEGRRLVSLTPRLVPQTVFTAKATHSANAISVENAKFTVKKAPLQTGKEKANLASSTSNDKLLDKNQNKETKAPELTRSASTSSNSSVKSQDGEKSKKKKKPNSVSNGKVLKPNKLNLQSKPDLKSSSAPNLMRSSLMSPIKSQKSTSSLDSTAKFHQKPLILQRSPTKMSSSSLSAKAEASEIASHVSHDHVFHATSKSPISGSNVVHGISSSMGYQTITDNTMTSSMFQQNFNQGMLSSNSSPFVQKMRFKAPSHKNKAKPTKPKSLTPVQRPSCVIVSSGNKAVASDTLNALGTSTVVPMAPISPVKPHIPSSSMNMMQTKSCSVKVVQLQKTNSTDSTHVQTPPLGKSTISPSSKSSSKVGNAQRVLALSNVPMSGNQQLKIASIPNVLQQSGTKIASIAKSVPMTTGFKMIAVTTVVPGSTQVKTVYIATPIMSVTKSTSTAPQSVSSFNAAQNKPAQTFMSPSNPAALSKPSIGLLNSRGFAPVSSSFNAPSVSTVASPASSNDAVISSLSGVSVAAKVISCTEAAKKKGVFKKPNDLTPVILQKPIISSSLVSEQKAASTTGLAEGTHTVFTTASGSVLHNTKPMSNELLSSGNNILTVDSSRGATQTTSLVSTPTQINSNHGIQLTGNSKTRNASDDNLVQGSSVNADESILLAGEQFLAELAAKFSQNNVERSKSDLSNSSDVITDKLSSATSVFKKKKESLFENVDNEHLAKENHANTESVNEKVIVRKIEDAYIPIMNESHTFGVENNSTVFNDHNSTSNPRPGVLSAKDMDLPTSILELNPNNGNTLNNLQEIVQTANAGRELQRVSSTESSTKSLISNSHRDSWPVRNTQETEACVVSSKNIVISQSSSIVVAGNKQTSAIMASSVQDSNTTFVTSFSESPILPDVQDSLITQKAKIRSSPVSILSQLKQRKFEALAVTSILSGFSSSSLATSSNKKTDLSITPVDSRGSLHPVAASQHTLPIINSSNTHKNSDVFSVLPTDQKQTTTSSEYSNCVSYTNRNPKDLIFKAGESSNDTVCSSASPRFTSPLNSPTATAFPSCVSPNNLAVDKTNFFHDSTESYVLLPTSKGPIEKVKNVNVELDKKLQTPFTQLGHESGQILLSNTPSQISPTKRPIRSPPKPTQPKSNLDSTVGQIASQYVSEMSSPADNVNSLLSSPKKRKIDPVSRTIASWTRGAMNLLQKVSRFRGPNKQKGEMNAASWFTRPVSPADAPGYYKVIKKPMDLSTIKKKLEDGVYKDCTEFYADMHLIKSNCYTYNPAEHIVRKDCDLVFAFFEEEYYKFMKKWQNPSGSPNKKLKLSP